MIVGRISEISRYATLSEAFRKAVEFLQSRDFSEADLSEGAARRFEIDGAEVFATLSRIHGAAPDFSRWEAHRQYADIQLVVEGGEEIRWLHLKRCKANAPFSEEKDAGMYDGEEGVPLRLEAGDFAVFFPEDAHLPCCAHPDYPEGSLKLVVKVRL